MTAAEKRRYDEWVRQLAKTEGNYWLERDQWLAVDRCYQYRPWASFSEGDFALACLFAREIERTGDLP